MASLPSLCVDSAITVVSGPVNQQPDHLLEQRAVAKLDITVLPMVTLFFLLSFMDRGNIGNARIAGFQHDLNLTDYQYQICVFVLYLPYMLSELPSNLILRKIGAQIMFPSLVTMWGAVLIAQGFVSSYTGLIVIRLILGALEGPIFPGVILYLSGFYTRQELSFRLAVFISAASISGAFSGLLAAALVNLDGIGGRPGWAWIFIVEGLITVLIGLIGFYMVPRTPADARFLSPSEKEAIIKRLERFKPHSKYEGNFTIKQVLLPFTSPHIILVFIIAFMFGSINIAIANFLPSIVKQLGYPSTKSQLLTVGPYVVTFIVTFIISYLSDRHNIRSVPIMTTSAITVVGHALYLVSHNRHLSYASLFFIVSGSYSTGPVLSSWLANNCEPHYKRASSIALGNMFASSGAILGIWRFPTKEGPRFTKTTIMDLCFVSSAILLSVINALYLADQNSKKKQRRQELLAPYIESEKGGVDEGRAWDELGDRHPDFVYVL
ncbi:hypothetical protein CVT24_001096 [Panaeolus cyanescens]|uniref:Major facilitator superfamily (MFS) profile domain-containing protein n=1 Tax=Panaeolus cyanescens TaxID=181874 RepID=A0A409YTG6_9AGAR|nr:hypothetical protein CVT24_001096 [Panaeolus cyanescens]